VNWLSFKVIKITVGKGKTCEDPKKAEWTRTYYELEAEISDESQLELAKGSLESLLTLWLGGETLSEPEKTPEPWWSPAKIKWEAADGPNGPYERSEDVNSKDFKLMLKDLQAHNGKLTREGFFYWVFTNGSTVGRKLAKR
jgi:hypothetical protein